MDKIRVYMASEKVGYCAKADFYGKRIAVLKDSKINTVLSNMKSAAIPHTIRMYRSNPLYVSKEGLILQDISFDSVSAAAFFVCGRSANGWVEWRTEAGVTLKALMDSLGKGDSAPAPAPLSQMTNMSDEKKSLPLIQQKSAELSPSPKDQGKTLVHSDKVASVIPNKYLKTTKSSAEILLEPAAQQKTLPMASDIKQQAPAELSAEVERKLQQLSSEITSLRKTLSEFEMQKRSDEQTIIAISNRLAALESKVKKPIVESSATYGHHSEQYRMKRADYKRVSLQLLYDGAELTNNIFSIRFVQVQAVDDQHQATVFETFIIDREDNIVSDIIELEANKKDGESPFLAVTYSIGGTKCLEKDNTCYIVLRYKDDGNNILVKAKYRLRIAFSNDFGF